MEDLRKISTALFTRLFHSENVRVITNGFRALPVATEFRNIQTNMDLL